MYNSRFVSFVDKRKTNDNEYNEEQRVIKKLRKLQTKLDDILINQTEILSLLNIVSNNLITIPPNAAASAEYNFFPMKRTEDLVTLDEALANNTNNKYISHMTKILRPAGTTAVQPLKKHFHLLFEEQLLMQLNFERTGNKEPFKQYKNINRAIFDIQQQTGYTPVDYIKEIREVFHLLQNCFPKRTYEHKKKLGTF